MSLKKWFEEEWVDIGRKKKKGKYQPCGRKKASTSRKGYPKCVPRSKAASMTEKQKRSAVKENEQKHKALVANQPELRL